MRGVDTFFRVLPLCRGEELSALGVGVSHLGDLALRAEVTLGLAVTVKAPPHVEGLGESDLDHLVDTPVTRLTTYTCLDMSAVLKVGIIWSLVDPHPLNGFVGDPAFTYYAELRAVCLDHAVTVHAGLGRRDPSRTGVFNASVAIATVNT